MPLKPRKALNKANLIDKPNRRDIENDTTEKNGRKIPTVQQKQKSFHHTSRPSKTVSLI